MNPRNVVACALFLAVFPGPIAASYGAYPIYDDRGAKRAVLHGARYGKAETVQGSPFILPMKEVVGEMRKRCGLKPEKGPCKAIFWKYHYDSASGKCREFMWGGCGGVVPFETETECRELCEKGAADGIKK